MKERVRADLELTLEEAAARAEVLASGGVPGPGTPPAARSEGP